MAATVSNQDPAAPTDDAQEQEKLEDQLEELKDLYLKMRGLRTVLPKLLAPLVSKPSSPRELYDDFTKAMRTTTHDIADFQQQWKAPETRAIFDRARQSRAAHPRGIYPWRPSQDPGWATRRKRKREVVEEETSA
ncbi:hypothetical protein P8C59_006689 [Phyllachora maydis]|uniref:Uncharacterized protein n=1 Tax=Phyllachora maydis TaxID=1825666 RepID=A0AAD9MET0_9PEZI|nr:hypothetical protein P8C59_006689 [Phyllachora maydis]